MAAKKLNIRALLRGPGHRSSMAFIISSAHLKVGLGLDHTMIG
jgi:hypothetical protein